MAGPSPSGLAPRSQSSTLATTSVMPRFDGNSDPSIPVLTGNARNIDMGASIYGPLRGAKVIMPPRPRTESKLGSEVTLALNTFNVMAYPSRPVYQFDVLVGSGTEKRGLVKALWNSEGVKKTIGGGKGWIFDGNKLAWSLTPLERELRVSVDLDEERKQKSKEGHENKHRVIIKPAKVLKFDVLSGYLAGKCAFDATCLETLTFIDHLLREWPSQRLVTVKRSLFHRGEKRTTLAPGIEHMAGVYQSLRLSHQPGKVVTGLTVNVDVSNGTFWIGGPMISVITNVVEARSPAEVTNILRRKGVECLKDLKKLHVTTIHRTGGAAQDEYTIDSFLNKDSKTYTFKSKVGEVQKQVSIYDYFMQKYNFRLQFPDWPVVKMTKKDIVVPIECLKLKPDQRYVKKLDEKATANMIKIAVTEPAKRWASVEHGLNLLKWQEDPYLKNYDMKLDTKPLVVKGRLLPPPEVAFANGSAKPGHSGRWDVRGKKFLTPNVAPLKSWGVCVLQGSRSAPDMNAVKHCITEFVKIYSGHGGKIESKQPVLLVAGSPDPGKAVEELYNKTGNHFKHTPQIMFFILPDRSAMVYGKIKKSAECRYGLVSQCMQYSNVQKAQGQYLSNVCLKVNAKLGGSTSKPMTPASKGPMGLFKVPTMVIGADVSHGPPGIMAPSMAAITASTDLLCTKFAAQVNTNGYRMEMISPTNIKKLMKPLIQHWMQNANQGRFPARIIYFRDGCGESQFDTVIKSELADIKALLQSAGVKTMPLFTVLTAVKRHHVRFFPKDNNKDRNGNPLPGTLVETGATHPQEWDFFLCSHAAIKGTARPAHYHVLCNEDGGAGNPPLSQDQLVTFINQSAYGYCRATTPISLPPAVYYAHLASKRALFHDKNFGAGSNERETRMSGSEKQSSGNTGGTNMSEIVAEDLMPMPQVAGVPNGINTTMWYV